MAENSGKEAGPEHLLKQGLNIYWSRAWTFIVFLSINEAGSRAWTSIVFLSCSNSESARWMSSLKMCWEKMCQFAHLLILDCKQIRAGWLMRSQPMMYWDWFKSSFAWERFLPALIQGLEFIHPTDHKQVWAQAKGCSCLFWMPNSDSESESEL